MGRGGKMGPIPGKGLEELDGDLIGPVAGKRDPADFGCKDGGSEGLMELAAWIDDDRSQIVEMRGG
jgi:hypothetical protein